MRHAVPRPTNLARYLENALLEVAQHGHELLDLLVGGGCAAVLGSHHFLQLLDQPILNAVQVRLDLRQVALVALELAIHFVGGLGEEADEILTVRLGVGGTG